MNDPYVLLRGPGSFVPTATNTLIELLTGTYTTSDGAVDNNSRGVGIAMKASFTEEDVGDIIQAIRKVADHYRR